MRAAEPKHRIQISEEVKRKCVDLLNSGKSTFEIYEEYYKGKSNASYDTFSRTLRNWKKTYSDAPAIKPEVKAVKNSEISVIEILKKGITVEKLAGNLGISPSACEGVIEDVQQQGYNVQRIGVEIKISNIVVPVENKVVQPWNGEKVIRFGLIGDSHINSKYVQLTHLHSLYDIYQREGIETVYHTGDIDEGEQMRPGHQYECYTQGADDHVKEIVKVFPYRKGISTQFITGNHDASIIKRCGYDIGYPIAKERDDMKYLGQSSAVINITPNCTLELRHPIDGSSYAISYRTQKMIDSMSGGEKPHILATGHYHKAEYIFYRNVHSFQTGCTLAQTPWMKGKGLAAHIGGWIVEVHVNDDGTITRIKQEYFPFYKEIKEDYLNWR